MNLIFQSVKKQMKKTRRTKGPVLPPYNPRLDLENYKFPSLDLLNEYEDDGPNIDMEEQNANKDRIIKVFT